MSRITLSFLGPFHVEVDGVVVRHFPTDKVRALLTYLALEPSRAHSRRELAALLWPEQAETQALSNVRNSLHRLQKTLNHAAPNLSAQLLTITRQTIQLNHTSATLDVTEFEALLAATNAHAHQALRHCSTCLAHLEEASALYRSELLTSFSLPDASPYEEWLALRRELLHQKALVALKQLTAAYEAQGNADKAFQFAARQLQLDPYQEEAHRQLMRFLAHRGLREEAIAQFKRLRQLLHDEMGVEPDVATMALYEEIAGGKRHPMGQPLHETAPATPQVAQPPALDWSEIPFAASFFGRAYELARLEEWLVHEGCQTVTLLGIGGVGKTSLAAQTIHRVAPHFQRLIWRSLLNAPPLETLLPGLLQTLAGEQLSEMPKSLDEQIALLLVYLRQTRVLLVLDNLESILDATQAGRFRPGYEGYQQFLQAVAIYQHRSALLLTSREQPSDLARLEGDTPRVRSLLLEGLDEAAGRDLLATRGIAGKGIAEATLVARYSGNPLALKLVADTVDQLFAGDIHSFLDQDSFVFDDIRTVLDQQFQRLSDLERELFFWLAIERKATSAHVLHQNQVRPVHGRLLLEALHSLQRRSLIDAHPAGFTLQNVVTEYLTARLVEEACAELQSQQFALLHRHALLKADGEDDVRQSQARLLLAPVAVQLLNGLGRTALERKLRHCLATLRQEAPRQPSYAAGNLLNLLLHLEIDVRGYDFSRLSVWQADLRGANLAEVNLADADLAHSVFTEAFGRIYALAINATDQVLAAGDTQGKIRLWSLPAGQSAGELVAHTNAVMSVAFHPDGALIASGSLDRTVRLWDWQTGRLIKLFAEHGSGVYAVAFSPDGAWLASAGQDCCVRLWDVKSGHLLAVMQQHTHTVCALAFHPSGDMLASGSIDQSILLWKLTPLRHAAVQEDRPQAEILSGEILQAGRLQGHSHQVLCLAYSPNGALLASGSADSTIQLWTTTEYRNVATLRGHSHWVRSLVFSPDSSRLYSGSADCTIRIWDIERRSPLHLLHGHEHVIRAIALHPNGALLASGGLDDTIRLWDLQRQQNDPAIRTIRGHVTAIRTIAFHPAGNTLAAGDGKGSVRLWSLDPKGMPTSPPRTLPGRGVQVNAVAISADGRWLASADDDWLVRLWNLTTLQSPIILQGHREAVHSVRFASTGNRLVSAGYAGEIYLWDIMGTGGMHGKVLNVLTGHTLEINDLRFTADGKHLISGAADDSIRVWELATGRCIQIVEETKGHCNTMALNHDKSLLAVAGSAGIIRLLHVDTQNQLHPVRSIHAHATPIFQVVFSPDGKYLASASEEGKVRLWEVETGKELLCLVGHTQPLRAVTYHPNGMLLASSSDDETVRLWAVEGPQPSGDSVGILRVPGPYTGMNIAGITGIIPAQRSALLALGAIEAHQQSSYC